MKRSKVTDYAALIMARANQVCISIPINIQYKCLSVAMANQVCISIPIKHPV